MAVSKAWTIKSGVKDSVNYVADENKTSAMKYIKNETKTIYGDKILVSGHLCNPQTAEAEFRMREESYHSVKKENIAKGVQPNQAIHIIQSFSAKDSAKMTPEQLHEYGMEFAGMICGEHFQAVVASHLNHSDQLHNHIIVNAYALDGAYKFIEDRACVKRIRELNDILCQSHGLEVIVPEKMEKVANYKEWQEKQNGTSWKEAIREDIKTASKLTTNWYDFKTYLENAGYEVVENQHSVSYKAPGCGYTVMDRKLGKAYERATLMEQWEIDRDRPIEEMERVPEPTPIKKKQTSVEDIQVEPYDAHGRKRNPIELLLLKTLKKLKFLKKYDPEVDKNSHIDSVVYGRVDWKIQNMLDTLALTMENNIQTQEDLSTKISDLGAQRNNLKGQLDGDNIQIQNMEQTIQEIRDFFDLEEIVDELGIDGSLLNVEMPDRETILEARAQQDPMTKKQKMDLYKLMETETEYKLDVKFGQISRTDAVDIIAFLKDKTKEQPALVITAEEFEKKRELARQSGADKNKQANTDAKFEKIPASPREKIAIQNLLKAHPEIQLKRQITNRRDAMQVMDYFKNGGQYPDCFVSPKDIAIGKLSMDDQVTVKSYLDLKEKLYSLGLTDMEKIEAYKEELKEKVNTFAKQKEQFNALGKEYAKFKRIEYNVELAKNPVYTQASRDIKVGELESEAEIDKEVREVRKEQRNDYRGEDKHFHMDDDER